MVRKTLLLLAILGLSRGVAEATAVTVDQVLYDSTGVVDSSLPSCQAPWICRCLEMR